MTLLICSDLFAVRFIGLSSFFVVDLSRLEPVLTGSHRDRWCDIHIYTGIRLAPRFLRQP